MATQRLIVSILYLGAATVIFYVLNSTIGRAMDELKISFTGYAANATVGAGWGTVITTQLGTWHWFFDAFLIVLIAVGIWAAKTTFIDTKYDRPGGGY